VREQTPPRAAKRESVHDERVPQPQGREGMPPPFGRHRARRPRQDPAGRNEGHTEPRPPEDRRLADCWRNASKRLRSTAAGACKCLVETRSRSMASCKVVASAIFFAHTRQFSTCACITAALDTFSNQPSPPPLQWLESTKTCSNSSQVIVQPPSIPEEGITPRFCYFRSTFCQLAQKKLSCTVHSRPHRANRGTHHHRCIFIA